METTRPTFIVGIGGSAGGLYAYTALLDSLPAKTGMAFVILAHMLPTANNVLADLLAGHTKMLVTVAADGMPVLANHVYVNPPNADLRVENDTFKVVSPRTTGNKQVDFFLVSLAAAAGPRAIAVVMSGYDGDGTQGCERIKAKGGVTFTQDVSATVGAMPLSAQASGSIDFVLSPQGIATELQKISARVRV